MIAQNLKSLLENKSERLCSVFFTAGFPKLNDTAQIIENLGNNGADFIEVGLPYSDPLADGTTIQHSSSVALKNGMHLDLVFEQLQEIQQKNTTPLVLMGYLNQVIKYGEERFCKACTTCGIDTVILPDLPIAAYEQEYKKLFEKYGIANVFLITPDTSTERILKIDAMSDAFIYVVASASITGAKNALSQQQKDYFLRIKNMQLKNKLIVGFGIANKTMFDSVCEHMNGAIIGSAFIEFLKNKGTGAIKNFMQSILKG